MDFGLETNNIQPKLIELDAKSFVYDMLNKINTTRTNYYNNIINCVIVFITIIGSAIILYICYKKKLKNAPTADMNYLCDKQHILNRINTLNEMRHQYNNYIGLDPMPIL